jgi:phenylpyruvate tautomerase PptA (4-oxalocrotonate tautomerase family)
MPIVKVYGVPPTTPQETLKDLAEKLVEAVVSIPELNLKSNEVSVFFPSDLMEWGLGEEIIAFVDGIFITPERTDAVRKTLAQRIGFALWRAFPRRETLFECFVRPFEPSCGFWSSAETKAGMM